VGSACQGKSQAALPGRPNEPVLGAIPCGQSRASATDSNQEHRAADEAFDGADS
jgi:hypothetical protein